MDSDYPGPGENGSVSAGLSDANTSKSLQTFLNDTGVSPWARLTSFNNPNNPTQPSVGVGDSSAAGSDPNDPGAGLRGLNSNPNNPNPIRSGSSTPGLVLTGLDESLDNLLNT